LFEFNSEDQGFYFDGIEWDSLDLKTLPRFQEWLGDLVESLTPDVKLKHKNNVSWRVEYPFDGTDYICYYSADYRSLRVSRAPSKQASLEEWGFSESQIKSLSQPGQIALVVGPQASGKSTVQKLLMRHATAAGVQARVKSPHALAPAPRQWYFGDEALLSFDLTVDLSFKGQSVCLAIEALDLEAALLKFLQSVPEKFKTRVINQLTVIETRLLPGIESIVVPFSSFYQLRYCPSNMIDRQDWASLVMWQEGQKDNFNVRTLNQVLLQGVIRRKIDMKTAFAASAYPEGLDHMLRRIGV
jgi:hypothetical protein